VGFFFCLSGVFSLWSIFVLFLNPFCPSFHFTFHATVLIQQTQHKHPCPRWDWNPRSLVSERP
jgi:hypothetical protein